MQQSFMPNEKTIAPTKRGKKKKPIQLWYRGLQNSFFLFRFWSRWGRYRTEKEAKQVIKDSARKNPELWEFKIGEKPKQPEKSPGSPGAKGDY